MTEVFKNGHVLVKTNHFPRDGEKVALEIDDELLQDIYEMVDLLSPYRHHVRDLLYMYVGELIELLPEVKEEKVADNKVIAVFETLLLALDYLTDKRLLNEGFKQEHRDYVSSVLEDCFEVGKRHSFIEEADRPKLNKGKIIQEGEDVYTTDSREEKTRIYLTVVYKKPKNTFEHFKHVGNWLAELDLKPDSNEIPYEQYTIGMTNHELHQDFLYEINRVKRTFSWFLNSYSCRENQFEMFDEMDIRSKLGIR